MDIDEDELARRKKFLQLGNEDIRALENLREFGRAHADAIVEALYEHFLSNDETRSFFGDPKVLDRLKLLQREYFLRLTEGNYGAEYVANRLRIGTTHERAGLAPQWYLGAYNFYLRAMAGHLIEALGGDALRALEALQPLMKVAFLDIELALDTYIDRREESLRKQREAIRELSIPVLQIRSGLLLVPIIGVIDTHRARLITDGLLRSIRENRAKFVVMDVTGVSTIDTGVANHLIQSVSAAGLMGASVIVTGLASDVSQALVALGVDLSAVETVGDLQSGIEVAEHRLGYAAAPAAESGGGVRPK